ncbi:reverse transcriptase domain-containing protein, partial [Streptococcus pyogenes]
MSTISKLFERIIMSKFSFSVKQFICPNQHGFVKSRSTVTNLSLFVNFCYNSFSNKSQVHTIYTDFSKAFDRVSHSILLQKLFKLGF